MGFFRKAGKAVCSELVEMLEWILRDWPGRIGIVLRRGYYRCRLKHVGKGVIIKTGVRFIGHRYITLQDHCIVDVRCMIFAGPLSSRSYEHLYKPNPAFQLTDGEVQIGRYVHVSVGCYILGHGGVEIGDYCGLAAGTRVLSVTNHYASFAEPSRRDVYFTLWNACFFYGPIVLKENVGVATYCVLLPGLCVEKDSFLSIGSVARGHIESNSIVAGNPAVHVKERFRNYPVEKG